MRFHSGKWGDGVVRGELLHIDGFTFTKGMVQALGWEVWKVCTNENVLLPLRRSIGHNANAMTESENKLIKEIPARGN